MISRIEIVVVITYNVAMQCNIQQDIFKYRPKIARYSTTFSLIYHM